MREDIYEILNGMWQNAFESVQEREEVFYHLGANIDAEELYDIVIDTLMTDYGWDETEIDSYSPLNVNDLIADVANTIMYEHGMMYIIL